MLIRAALTADTDRIWAALEPTIRAGETLALARNLTREDALSYWFLLGHEVFVAEQAGELLGTYFMGANQAGGGAHVATASFVVTPSATGRGIAQAMCEHALAQARSKGFLAMQFNLVVSTDERTVRLWERAGFNVVGRLPKAFQHLSAGLVDALVMYRAL